MRAGTTAMATLALVAALAACGRGGAEREAQAAAERFYGDVARKDGAAACRALSDPSRTELEQREGKPCAEAVTGLELSGRRAVETSIFGRTARVDLLGGDSVFLEETDQGWKVSAAGCTPRDPEQPYDCEVRA